MTKEHEDGEYVGLYIICLQHISLAVVMNQSALYDTRHTNSIVRLIFSLLLCVLCVACCVLRVARSLLGPSSLRLQWPEIVLLGAPLDGAELCPRLQVQPSDPPVSPRRLRQKARQRTPPALLYLLSSCGLTLLHNAFTWAARGQRTQAVQLPHLREAHMHGQGACS
jgi:hypothetical protein